MKINNKILENYIRHRNIGEVGIDEMTLINNHIEKIIQYLFKITIIGALTMISLCAFLSASKLTLGITFFDIMRQITTGLLIVVSCYFVATIYRTNRMHSHWAFYQVMAIRRSYQDDSKTFSEIFGKKPAEYRDVSVMSQDVEQIITNRILDVLVFKRREIRNGELRARDMTREAFDTAICFCPVNGYNKRFARAKAVLDTST